tara:strand:+ start:2332 stop:3330 length:999 start_codon:yes stop_codon:yes gene_type:complete
MGLSGLFISSMAAFFSVTGIGMLFSGSFIAVCMMAASLEVGKLVTASFLYRYWSVVNWLQKTYMTIATIVLIGITSMGIFGFLSNSYMGATQEFDGMITKLNVYKDQLETLEEDKVFLKEELETSVNALPDNYITAKRKLREEYNPLIQEKSVLIAELKQKVGKIEIEMVDTGIDVGPLLYISEAFNTDIDTAVKWIMFILILVFDPLAVIMVIGFNIALLREDEDDDSGKKEFKVFNQPPPTPKVYTQLDDEDETNARMDVIGQNGNTGEHYDEEVSTNPLENWKNKTEQKIKDEGITMGNEVAKRNSSQDGGEMDAKEPETVNGGGIRVN